MSDLLARYYPVARTAHLERLEHFNPGEFYYRSTRADWDLSMAPDGQHIERVSVWTVAWRMARGRFGALEIAEPLALPLLPGLFVIAVLHRLVPKSRRPRLVCYAIENLSQIDKLTVKVRSRWVARFLLRAAWWVVVPRLDRIAFGTAGSLAVYECDLGASLWRAVERRVQLKVFEALPQAMASGPVKSSQSVVFLGTFETRKGYDLVLRAWPEVKSRIPGCTLVMLGKGPGLSEVIEAVARDPSIRVEVDPLRERIYEVLASSQVLVLPSRRTSTWREQVGLPIVEGLSFGCTIVTTSETGLASWLSEHGHFVVDEVEIASQLVRTLSGAILSPLSPDVVLASLPREDQRVAADHWLSED